MSKSPRLKMSFGVVSDLSAAAPFDRAAERHLLMTAHSLRTSPSQTVAKQ
jgi:hypothetical protein